VEKTRLEFEAILHMLVRRAHPVFGPPHIAKAPHYHPWRTK